MVAKHSRVSAFAICLLAGASLIPASAWAQAGEPTEVEEVEVFASGSRLPANVTSVPGTVTIIDQATIEAQSAISSDLGRILASAVPGMSPSAQDGNNYSQTIRGRKPAFFVDGIPQSADLRGGGRDLRIIHPSVLQRVEVINGATSIYGLGGSGGVVNYITKRPTEEGVRYTTEAGLTAGLSNLSSKGIEYGLTQSITAVRDRIDFVGSVTYQSRGLYYDGDGDLIPPDPTGQTGIADMTEISLFGKLGFDIAPDIRWETTAIYYNAEVDTDYTVKQGSFAGGIKSVAERKRQNNIIVLGIPFDFIGEEDPSSYNFVGYSTLLFEDVLGNDVKLSAYYKESEFVWRHLDFLAPLPSSGGFPPSGSQLVTYDDRAGVRIDVNTPVNFSFMDGFVLWGAEYSQNNMHEQLIDGRDRTSKMKQENYAIYAQLQVDITDWLHLRTGFRNDDFTLDVPSFMALDFFNPAVLHTVNGASIDYNSLTGNFGLVADLGDNFSVYGSWSSGFSIGNVARTIGGLRPNVPTAGVTYDVADLGVFIEPVKVDSYEAGLRFNFDRIWGSVGVFKNESDLGATFNPITLQIARAPEEIKGIEVVVNAKPVDGVRVGASYTSMDSKTDTNDDGKWDGPLDFGRVPPDLVSAYVELDLPQSWLVRVQSNTVFDEKRFSPPFGQSQRHIPGYTLFDAFASGPVGPGRLSLGIENLFNKSYRPMTTYMNCADHPLYDAFCNTYGVGARGSLKYTISY